MISSVGFNSTILVGNWSFVLPGHNGLDTFIKMLLKKSSWKKKINYTASKSSLKVWLIHNNVLCWAVTHYFPRLWKV